MLTATVEQLIEKLLKCDPQTPVVIYSENSDLSYPVKTITPYEHKGILSVAIYLEAHPEELA